MHRQTADWRAAACRGRSGAHKPANSRPASVKLHGYQRESGAFLGHKMGFFVVSPLNIKSFSRNHPKAVFRQNK
jgi:hypothetical protein